jgi:hypothetical protein
MAAKKKAAKKAAKAANGEKKVRRSKFGTDMKIVGLPSENWRREGTANHGRAAEVISFMKKKPNATVAEVIAGTSYRKNDFDWDLERKVFKVQKVKPAAATAEASA